MLKDYKDFDLIPNFNKEEIVSYKIVHPSLKNEYYLTSSKESRNLLKSPEVVGHEVYTSLLPSTRAMVSYFNSQNKIHNANILTILRGALNYPLEEACCKENILVHSISFLSSERTFDENGNVNGLEIKYNKLDIIDDSTLMIGDIIASGDTLIHCMDYIIKAYKEKKKQLKNIIVFTIGGNKTFEILEKMTNDIQKIWPSFEGFSCVFYEGVFSCYEDNGYSGINRPMIDFIWRDGIISPEFRKYILSFRDPLFEKCIIYDGGARRYEIKEHINEVLEFWNGLLERSNQLDKKTLLEEKLGHLIPMDFDSWVKINHYSKLSEELNIELYEQELKYIDSLKNVTLKEICETRIKEFSVAMKEYQL